MSIACMPTRDAPQYALFGKLPSRADFVRINTNHPAVQECDELLARSLAFAKGQADWDGQGYLDAGASDFHYTSNDGRWCFFGVLRPSRDASGRHYPLVAGIVLPAAAVAPYCAELSIANELFFASLRDRLARILDDAAELDACRHYLETQCAPNPHAQADIDLASQVLERHVRRTSAARLRAGLDQAGLDDHLLAFVFHANLLRRLGASVPRQAVLLPLSRGAGEDILDQAVWLALYREATGKKNNRAPDFITLSREGGRFLALSPGRFSERFLAVLWGTAPDPSSSLDVGEGASWRRHPAYAEAARTLEHQLRDPGASLAALFSTIAGIARHAA
ncbi:MAG: type VI secretion system-associated protein TagF [Azoarcus sp.]|jgi:type VI secretion system protein ImpM|nr:type VI secretion system-associated protein TagF [Azoarcus sp.]